MIEEAAIGSKNNYTILNEIMNYVFNNKPNPYVLRDMLIALCEDESGLEDSGDPKISV